MTSAQPIAEDSKAAIPATSPALALERSLTDPETRGEWTVVKVEPLTSTYGWTVHSTKYRNEARDITITSSWSINGSSLLYTPFTLTNEEKAIVSAALCAWNAKNDAIKQSEALARLVAPIPASVDRNPEGGDAHAAPSQSDESAVGEAETPTLYRPVSRD